MEPNEAADGNHCHPNLSEHGLRRERPVTCPARDVHCECRCCENAPDAPAYKVCEVCDKHFCDECLYECSRCGRIVCCDCGRACGCGADHIACPDPECRKGCPDCHGTENLSTPTAKGE